MVNHEYLIAVHCQSWTKGQSPLSTMDQRTKSMVNYGPVNVVHGQPRKTRLSPWSNMDTYMQSMVRT